MNRIILSAALISCLLMISSSNKGFGQEVKQNHEIGLWTSNLSQFQVIYKKQKSENTFTRLRFASGKMSLIDADPFKLSVDLGFAGGKEKRRPLSDKLYFVTGFDLACYLHSSINANHPSISLTPGLGGILGCTYLANDKFLVGFEVIPSASFQFGYRNDDIYISDLELSFSTTSAGIFAAYRFSR